MLCCLPIVLYAQSVEDILADIYESLAEEGITADWEDLSQDLYELHQHKMNINTVSVEDLQRLRFLSPMQIDDILYYVDKHPMADICELQLISSLRDYEIRNLSYFLVAEKSDGKDTFYPKDIFRYANHELTLRTDVRNAENFTGDPLYANWRYRFNYRNKVQAGFTVLRAPNQPWKELNYGGYIQVRDLIPHVKTLVLGNFEGQFGQGLVLGQTVHRGKSAYFLTTSNGTEGVKKYSSVSPSYDYLHGVAATLNFGPVDITTLYSLRKEKTLWHHVAGLNTTYRGHCFQVGLTALEDIYHTDSTYTSFGVNGRFVKGKWDVFGEVAASYDAGTNRQTSASRWGVATLLGLRVTPIQDLSFLVQYRYFSPTYHNRYAYAFAESTKVNDENGLFIGTEIRLVPKWIFSLYADGFRFADVKYGIHHPSTGWDVFAQAEYETTSQMNMFWKFRAKRKGEKNTYSLRYQYTWEDAGWHLRTQVDGSLVKGDSTSLTWGVSVYQDICYTFRQVPITLQLRLQGFDIRNWDNRVYVYENDVLYASTNRAVYGRGGLCYLNMRYKIKDWLSVYLKVSEVVYHPQWESQQRNRTDVHLLFRFAL